MQEKPPSTSTLGSAAEMPQHHCQCSGYSNINRPVTQRMHPHRSYIFFCFFISMAYSRQLLENPSALPNDPPHPQAWKTIWVHLTWNGMNGWTLIRSTGAAPRLQRGRTPAIPTLTCLLGRSNQTLWNETQEFLQSRFVEKLNLLYFLPQNEVGVSVRRRITAGVDGGHFTIGVQ